jgi:hypothetical protein
MAAYAHERAAAQTRQHRGPIMTIVNVEIPATITYRATESNTGKTLPDVTILRYCDAKETIDRWNGKPRTVDDLTYELVAVDGIPCAPQVIS